MEANLAGDDVATGPATFPYSNWGPVTAILGVILALGAGIVLGVPALLLGLQHGAIEEFHAPAFAGKAAFDEGDSTDVATGIRGVVYGDHETEIAAFDDHDNELPGSPFGEFEDSHGIAASATSGRIYVSDQEGGSVSVFQPLPGRRAPRLASRLARTGLPARLADRFEPERLAVGSYRTGAAGSADVFVIDRGNDAVLELSPSGRYRGRIAGSAIPEGSFGFDESEEGNAVAVDSSGGPGTGNLYVLASHEGGDSGALWAFSPAGSFLWELAPSAGEDFCGVAVDAHGALWIADAGGGVSQYALSGAPGKPPTPTGKSADTPSHSCAIAFGDENDLYAAHVADGKLSTAANIFVQLTTALGFLLVPMAIAAISGAASLREILARLGIRRFRPSALKWMAAAVGVYLVSATLYSQLILEPHQKDIAQGFGAIPVQVLLIVFAAPVSEEVCFRGMLFGGLREKLPRVAAALICGLIFGGLHALTGVSAVPPLILFGFLLSLLYEKTGSIVPGILLHMLNNSVALLGQ